MNGGFALISGEPGLGKSKTLQLIANKFGKLDEVVVGVMERPQSSVGDFYREMGVLFGVNLSPANRYGGFKDLRERWKNHVKTTLFRPILIIGVCQASCRLFFQTKSQALPHNSLMASDEQLGAHSQP